MSHIGPGMQYKCQDCGSIGDRAECCACCQSQSIFNVARVWDVPRLSAEAAKVMWVLGEVMGERVAA